VVCHTSKHNSECRNLYILAYLIIGSLTSDHEIMGRIFSTRYGINSGKIFSVASDLSKTPGILLMLFYDILKICVLEYICATNIPGNGGNYAKGIDIGNEAKIRLEEIIAKTFIKKINATVQIVNFNELVASHICFRTSPGPVCAEQLHCGAIPSRGEFSVVYSN
jgi:hypothetical protein